MGDVFDAINRARREKGEKVAPPATDLGPLTSGDPEAPALPIDQVAPAAQARRDEDAPAPLAPALRTAPSVAAASEKSQRDLASQHDKAVSSLAHHRHDPKLNGYAPEVVVHHDRGSVITEQYRAIRTQILARCRNRRLQVHVVTSSNPEEGKSVTSLNLSIAFSELRDQRILLVEGDMRKPSFSKLFNRKFDIGLIQLLNGQLEDVDKALHPTVYENLAFLPAGGKDPVSSTELLSSPRMAKLLERLKDRFDHIFIDTPPIVTVTDAAILGAMADQTILVVRLGHTPVEVVDRAKRLLRAANCEIGGMVLTHLTHNIPKYLYRYA